MRIAVVGVGRMGSAIAWLLVRAGHEVRLTYSRAPERLRAVAAALGERAREAAPREAVDGADVVVLAVQWDRVDDALAQLGAGDGALDGRILLDVGNPMTDDVDEDLAVPRGTSGAEEVARRAPRARVVKALNTIPAELLQAIGRHPVTPRPNTCVCGDDAAARAAVARLAAEMGLEPVDAGPLKVARWLEPFALVVAQLAYEQELGPALGVQFVPYPS